MRFVLPLSCLLLMCALGQSATVTVGSWSPIYRGVELASGQQAKQTSSEQDHQVLCLRIDLTDPDIVLFTTPRCTNCSLDTLSDFPSDFLEQYGLQVAVNGNFYASSSGPSDTPQGTAEDVYGLAISKGVVVSAANESSYASALLFTTNNVPFYVPTNAPATNTTGIYTAVSGNHPLLLRGVNVGTANTSDLDPRTAVGLSQDRRYLFLLTIDGRQTGWSDGADFYNTGEWLKRFGAYDGINVDGGGSTTMVKADCQGKAVRLNRSSFVAAYGRERNNGHNLGVYARPLPSDLKNLNIEVGATTALVTWRTDLPMTTQLEYGLTSSYGAATALETRLGHHHVISLANLSPGSNYFFRALSTGSGLSYTQACQFTTLYSVQVTQVFGLTQVWRYTTNNLNGVAWTAPSYNDTNWLGQGPGLLYVENNAAVQPRNTVLPPTYGQTIAPTYYFRTHFTFTDSTNGVTLLLSNYVDDGAVFYLNGAEVYRLRVAAAPTAITYTTTATGVACAGTAQSGDAATNCPDLFTLTGSALTNLAQGDNVLAVEVHNYGTLADIVFGSALIKTSPTVSAPRLNIWAESDVATLFWNGTGFTLQQRAGVGGAAAWSNAPGSPTQGPITVTSPGATFYRLKN